MRCGNDQPRNHAPAPDVCVAQFGFAGWRDRVTRGGSMSAEQLFLDLRKGTDMIKRLFAASIAASLCCAFAAGTAGAQTLEKIKQRGVLVVADKLGVRLEIEPVVSSNRMQFLQQGKIDLMIATMNDKPDRRLIVGIIEPSYYASGVNVLANKKAALKNWEQLKGQPICAIQGAWYNKPVAEKYGAEIVAFKGQTEAETALLQGNCVGWVYDDTAFAERLADPKWAGFEMALPSIMEEPWGLAVALPERDGPWGKFMAEALEEWHRNGKLIELEKKWGIQASAYLRMMHEKYMKKS